MTFWLSRLLASLEPKRRRPALSADIPFTRFDGWLKCMRTADLDEEQAAALKITFARFFEDSATSEEIEWADRAFRGGGLREREFGFRRFAGGADLPRGRYYSVCLNESGNDGGTLCNELLAYVDSTTSGNISVWDFCDPKLTGVQLPHQARSPGSGFHRYSIGVSFHSRRGLTSPFFTELKKIHRSRDGPLKHIDEEFTVYFPLRVEKVSIDKTIDLRLPHVQEWFAKQVFSGIPTACYIYHRDVRDAKDILDILKTAKRELLIDIDEIDVVKSHSKNDEVKAEQIAAGRTSFLLYAAHPEGEQNIVRCPDKNFYALLLILMFHPRGGSPIIDAIGSWLREIGTNALIFPSARTDTHLHIEGDTLKYFEGWNLVDYRGAPPPSKYLRVIQNPASFIDTRRQFRCSLANPTERHMRGSFQVRGIIQRQQMEWIYGQELFWQSQRFSDEETLHRKDFVGIRFESGYEKLSSLAEIRAAVKAGMIDLGQVIERKDALGTRSKKVGQWLAEYVDQRVENRTGSQLQFGAEWFLFRLDPYFEPQIICPICEYSRLWSIDRREPADEKCPSCNYERPNEFGPEETMKKFEDLCRSAS